MEKYCRPGQARDVNTTLAYCMLDTVGYKYTHSGYVILIVFPLQEWLHERASILHYTYIDILASANLINTSVKYIVIATYSDHLILIDLVTRITCYELNEPAWIRKKQ